MLKRKKYKFKAKRKYRRQHIPPFLPLLLILSLGALLTMETSKGPVTPPGNAHAFSDKAIRCISPYIIDGDTMDCSNHRIRLDGIDAPEMPGHCRPGRNCTPGDPHEARKFLHAVSRGSVTCIPDGEDSYGRTIARCSKGNKDLSCAMIRSGHAVRRYSHISCDI